MSQTPTIRTDKAGTEVLVDLYATYQKNPLCNDECIKERVKNSVCEDPRLKVGVNCWCLLILSKFVQKFIIAFRHLVVW